MNRDSTARAVGMLSIAGLTIYGFTRRRGEPDPALAGAAGHRYAATTRQRPPPPSPPPSKQASPVAGQAPPRETAHSDGQDSGRGARTPLQIPRRGWKQILVRVYQEIGEDRLLAEAAGVTFYVLLAIFPALTALVALFGLVADPHIIERNISLLQGVLPGGGLDIIDTQLKSLTAGPPKALGIGALVGLLTSLWSANAGMKAVFDALNVVYEEKETRSFVRRTLISFAFTLGGMAFLMLALGAVLVLPVVLAFVGFGGTAKVLISLARWPLLLITLSLLLSAIYRYGPSRKAARWSWVSWGGGLAILCWLVVSLAFSYYVQHFGSYNKTYGSLGAAIGFMTWIWLSSAVVLAGAELNAEMERQTEHDTTEGHPKPLGHRDATMADQVAAD